MDNLKVGIFLGGQSKEREVSLVSGRSVYDHICRKKFIPIPIFVDGLGNFIQLDWKHLYKGTIRDFYPFVGNNKWSFYEESLEEMRVEEMQKIGKVIYPHQFSELFDIAFLALHGIYGEDGAIQSLLDWYQIPYTGTSVLGSALCMNKHIQKLLLQQAGLNIPRSFCLNRDEWRRVNLKKKRKLFKELCEKVKIPMVIKNAQQGSTISLGILTKRNINDFTEIVDHAFCIKRISSEDWISKTEGKRKQIIQACIEQNTGIGLPVLIGNTKVIYHPEELYQYLNKYFKEQREPIELAYIEGGNKVICEEYLRGYEFSCIVLQEHGEKPLALLPTEILKKENYFSYRAKYLPGIVKKYTPPIHLSQKQIQNIREISEKAFEVLECNTYARMDGFITKEDQIYLNDPNTTSGMEPSSFIFHQAANLGLQPTELITFIIRNGMANSLNKRFSKKKYGQLKALDKAVKRQPEEKKQSKKVGVIMGGFSSERHISLESGRNVYQKLCGSQKYVPIPIFLSGSLEKHDLYIIPINILLKNNADDIHEILQAKDKRNLMVQRLMREGRRIIEKYTSNPNQEFRNITYEELKEKVDTVFIALHGIPGEDGTLQKILEKHEIFYNGSGPEASNIMMNKYLTNRLLDKKGIEGIKQFLINKSDWLGGSQEVYNILKKEINYPCIGKPVDEGCSEAVLKINDKRTLDAYCKVMFREKNELQKKYVSLLGVYEEFPMKKEVLIEEFISKSNAKQFVEITAGIITRKAKAGAIEYIIFQPSETVASRQVLSIEEKFLAGEGRNITPITLTKDPAGNAKIISQIQDVFKKVAKILKIEGYARIDAFVKINEQEEIKLYIIEINSLPAMTPATCLFTQAALEGYTPLELIEHIIEEGLWKRKNTICSAMD